MSQLPVRSILSALSWSSVLLLLLAAPWGQTRAQSTDPANPTPIALNPVEGKAGPEGVTHYYRFKAEKGSVTLTLKGQTNYYSTMFEAALTNMKGDALGKLQVPAGEKAASASETFNFDGAQDVNIAVKLLKDDTLKWQQYTMTLGGGVGAGGGQQDTSTLGLPDLVFSKVDYQEGPGSKRGWFKGTVVFCVKNAGNGDAGSFKVRLAVHNGNDENSELHGTPQYFQFAPLAAGKEICWHSSSESSQPIFIGKGRLLWVDPSGAAGEVKEANEKNNKSWTNFPPRGVK